MAAKIGFITETEKPDNRRTEITSGESREQKPAHKSVVKVYFPERNMTLTYYNDLFDLKCGDLVYVEGKLEGVMGRVTEVNYNFKIKISDYKRVTAVADTDVKGKFYMAGSHFVTFDRETLPEEKVLSWFKAPAKDDDEFVTGSDDTAFRLDNPGEMNIDGAAAERGHNYYLENRVRYISLDGTHGYAVVEGTKAYEVEFEYVDGEISHLICSCFCIGACKHQFAAILQLRETLDIIEKNYSEEFARTGCFAAVSKGILFAYAVDGKDKGSFTLS